VFTFVRRRNKLKLVDAISPRAGDWRSIAERKWLIARLLIAEITLDAKKLI